MKRRSGDPWMPADAYRRTLAGLSVNLLVRDVALSLPVYASVLGLRVIYHDVDFAALAGPDGAQVMLHADHTYERMALAARVAAAAPGTRGTGVELRLLGIDPDAVQARAEGAGVSVPVPAADFPHGWRECHGGDRDGYVWAMGVPTEVEPAG